MQITTKTEIVQCTETHDINEALPVVLCDE